MPTTLLEVARELAARIGLPRPATIVSGDGDLPPQYQALIYEAARDIIRRNNEGWQALKVEKSFTSVATEAQFAMTSLEGFRRVCEGTEVNITQRRRIHPLDAREHSAIRLLSITPPFTRYRIYRNQFVLPGNAVAGDSIFFEYDSNAWLTDTTGETRKLRATADSDLVLLDDELLILGAKWRFKKENGLSYGEDFNDFDRLCQSAIGNDTPKHSLNMGGGESNDLIGVNYNIVVGS